MKPIDVVKESKGCPNCRVFLCQGVQGEGTSVIYVVSHWNCAFDPSAVGDVRCTKENWGLCVYSTEG